MAPLTGRKVFFIAASFFGVIIAVNVFMAVKAVSTFPGLEAESGNGYVESQSFDRMRSAQLALGWTVTLGYDKDGKVMSVDLRDRDGRPADVSKIDVLVGRPTQANEDVTPAFSRRAGVFVAPVTLGPGRWMVRVEAQSQDGTEFLQRLAFYVQG